MKTKISIALASILLLTTSCATVFTRSKQSVLIKSNPSGALIEINGVEQGTTPANIELKKGFSGQIITLTKEGFKSHTFTPATTFNPVSVVNLLFLPGFIIDAATGAMMKYDPIFYEINLKPEDQQL
ncbi:PEGA domain-containing protein [Sphingobacterium sp. 1.A.5]|uniref:PEGA domain-containing protein n=1 Tax=Sphingobacterium sp. 1.A.5 TaxID=2044604 RepID=UPI000C0C06B6|nr:PEGA domain-containing protein [Sphingobacterium sp. 1.A.5]